MKEPETIRVLLADQDKQFCSRAAEAFKGCAQIELIGVAHKGGDALEAVRTHKPDLLVLDAALPGTDGLLLAKQLRSDGLKTGVMLLSVFISTQFGAECELLNIDTLLRKPVLPEVLLERIRLWADAKAHRRGKAATRDLRRRIQSILNEIGMAAGTKGYRDVTEAIYKVVERGNAVSGMTKELYPEIAKAFGTNANCVERNIRNAIESAWTHGDRERQQFYMGHAAKPDDARPSNRDFINKIANLLRSDEE